MKPGPVLVGGILCALSASAAQTTTFQDGISPGAWYEAPFYTAWTGGRATMMNSGYPWSRYGYAGRSDDDWWFASGYPWQSYVYRAFHKFEPVWLGVVVDNRDPAATFTGTWSDETGYSWYLSTNYRRSTDAAATGRFTPNIPVAGDYDVFIWYPTRSSSNSVQVTINHAGGTDIVSADQSSNGGQWNLLGSYAFNAGSGGWAEILANGSGVLADAFKFEPKNAYVVSAKMRLWKRSGGNLSDNMMGCYGIKQHWHGWHSGADWFRQKDNPTGVPDDCWEHGGAEGETDRNWWYEDVVSCGAADSIWLEWDVTNTVQDWFDGACLPEGFIFQDQETVGETCGFRGDGHISEPDHRPQMVIQWDLSTAPRIGSSPSGLVVKAAMNSAAHPQATFTVNNVGGAGTFDWTAAADDGGAGWLSIVSGASGSDGGAVTVEVNQDGYGMGRVQGYIDISCPTAVPAARRVPVVMWVLPMDDCAPWSGADVGDCTPGGELNLGADSYKLWGEGYNLWNDTNKPNGWRFLYRQVTDEFILVGNAYDFVAQDSNAKMGFMVTDGLGDGFGYEPFFMALAAKRQYGLYMISRDGLSSGESGSVTWADPNFWLKIERKGLKELKGYKSLDGGNTWTPVSTIMGNLPRDIYVGMFSMSRYRSEEYGVGEFRNVQLTRGPVASFTPTTPLCTEGDTIDFTDTSTTPDGVPIVTWSWMCPNASPATSSVQSPSITFIDYGTYTLTLTVTDENGLQSETSTEIVVETGSPDVWAAESHESTRVWITFSETLDPTTSQDPLNYAVSDGTNSLQVYSATLLNDDQMVALKTSPHQMLTDYTVTINNVEDVGNTPVAPDTQYTYQFVPYEHGLHAEYHHTGLGWSGSYPTWGVNVDFWRTDRVIQMNGPGLYDFMQMDDFDGYYGVKWAGKIRIVEGGTHSFFLTCRDMGRIYVDGQMVVDNQGTGVGPREGSGTIDLAIGWYDFEIWHWHNYYSTKTFVLEWTPPGGSRETLPQTVIFHVPLATGRAPNVVSVRSIVSDEVRVTFDQPVEDVTAVDVANYSLEEDAVGPVTLTGAWLSADWKTVVLKAGSALNGASAHTLTVGGINNLDPLNQKTMPSGITIGFQPETTVAGVVGKYYPWSSYYYQQDARRGNYPPFWDLTPDQENTDIPGGTITTFTDAQIAFDGSAPINGHDIGFGVRWRGFINVPATGFCGFKLEADDQARAYVGGLLACFHDGAHTMAEAGTGELWLEAGWHTLEVWYYQNDDATYGVVLSYWPDGFADWQVVPGASLANVVDPPTPVEIAVDTPEIQFDWRTGRGNPADVVVTVTDANATGLMAWSAYEVELEGGDWLSIVPSGAASGDTLTVSVDVTGLNPDVYDAYIVVNDPGASPAYVYIPVTLRLQGARAYPIVTGGPLTFNATVGGSDPATQPLTIQNGSDGTVLSWGADTMPTGSWLSVSPISGTLTDISAEVVDVAVDIGGLRAGTYAATVTFSDPAADPNAVTVDVTLVMSSAGKPVIWVEPPELTFKAMPGGSDPDPQYATVSNIGDPWPDWSWDATVAVITPPAGDWLSVDPSSAGGHSYRYAYRRLAGDFALAARIQAFAPEIPRTQELDAKAGLMIRNGLSTGANWHAIVLTGGNEVWFQSSAGQVSKQTPTGDIWLRLERTGNSVAGYYSPDGAAWTEVGSGPGGYSGFPHVGMCVGSAHDGGERDCAQFRDIDLVGSLPCQVTALPTSGTAPFKVDCSGTVTGGAGACTWAWDFGDGATSALEDPEHLFTRPGTYVVTATVTDALGLSGTDTVTIQANAGDYTRPYVRNVLCYGQASTDVVSIDAQQDTFLRLSAPDATHNADSSYGLHVDSYPTEDAQALIQFDLSGIPGGATIQSATMKSYCWRESGGGGGTDTVEVYRCDSLWTEGAATWNTDSTNGSVVVTTVNIPDFTGMDAGSDANLVEPPLPLDIDVTGLVQDWYNSTYPNYGVRLYPNDADLDTRWVDREDSPGKGVQYVPALEVTYEEVGSGTDVLVVFSEPVDAATAEDVLNYTINGVNPTSATLGGDGKTVTLVASTALLPSNALVVSNVSDLSSNTIAADSQSDFEVVAGGAPVTADLIAHYKLDEFTGETIAVDSAGPNDGTLVGNTAPEAEGVFGTGYSFDGNGDYVNCGNDPTLLIQGDMTLAIWVKPNVITGERGLASKWGSSWCWVLQDGVNRIYFNGWKAAATAVPVGAWSHVALVYDDAANTIYFYLNGLPDGTAAQTANQGTGANLTIGQRGGNGSWFDGLIDDVRIYNRALTVAEVESLQVQGGQPPVASFTPASTSDTAPHNVSFDGSASSDADGTIASYEWDFDYDGAAFTVDATGATPSNSYAAGTYTVALRVTDDVGLWDIEIGTVVSYASGTNNPATVYDTSVNTPAGVPVLAPLLLLDPDGLGPYTYTQASAPSSGTLTGTGPDWTYTPNGGFTGIDSFAWTVNDGVDESLTATVTINVNSGTPVIDRVGPASDSTAGGAAVTVYGKNFADPVTSVTFGGAAAGNVVRTGWNTITCDVPAGPAGPVDVAVITADGAGSLVNGFIYVQGDPVVTVISPDGGDAAGGESVTIAGQNFAGGLSVTIGGSAATVSSVTATSIVCVTPVGAAGAADVVVTNPDTGFGTLAGGFTYSASAPWIGVDVGGVTTPGYESPSGGGYDIYGDGRGIWLTGDGQSMGVFVTLGSLTTGTYTAEITVAADGADPFVVPVTFRVQETSIISPDPSEFLVSALEGAAPLTPFYYQMTVNNAGEGFLAWESAISYISGSDWLSLSMASGWEGETTWLQFANDTLTAGTYEAEILLTDQAGFAAPVAVPVTLVVNSVQPTIDLAVVPVSFVADEDGPNPAPQMVTVGNTGGGTLNWVLGLAPPTWLTLTPTYGGDGQAVVLNVDITGMTNGIYAWNGNVIDESAANSPLWFTVNLNISPPPQPFINFDPVDFSETFTGKLGMSPPAPATRTVVNEGDAGTALAWTAFNVDPAGDPWIYIDPATLTGTDDQPINFGVNFTGIAVEGTYTGEIRVEDPNVSNMLGYVPVFITFVVEPPAALVQVNPTELYFEMMEGESNPPAETVTVTNVGSTGTTLSWNVEDSESWLSASPTSGTDDGSFSVSVDGTGFGPGTYTGTVTVWDDVTGRPESDVDIPVTFVVISLNPQVAAVPATLTFTAMVGGQNPTAQSVQVVNAGGGDFDWTAAASEPWISVSPASGPKNGTFLVSIDITGLSVGLYPGSITITGSGAAGTDTVAVTLDVVGEPILSPSPASLAFEGVHNGDNPLPQQVVVSNSGGETLNWIATKEGGVNWMVLANNSGTDDDAFSVYIYTAGLNAGTHTTYVRILDALADSVDVPVTLTLWGEPVFAPSPSGLNFAAVEGGPSSDPQVLTVNNAGEWQLDWTAIEYEVSGGDWLSISPASGSDGDGITVSVDSSGLAIGEYLGKIRLSDPLAGPPNHDVAVKLVVSAQPVIAPSPSALNLVGYAGGPDVTANIVVNNSGGTTLSWLATVDDGGSTGWITALPLSGIEGGTILVTTSPGASARTFTGAITIYDDAAIAASVVVPITLVVEAAPVVAPFPTSLNFAAVEGGADPDSQTVTVSNSGGWHLDWTATKTAGGAWLSVFNGSGTDGDAFTVNVSTGVLPPATYTGSILVEDGIAGTQATVDVTFVVSEPDNPVASPSAASLSFNAYMGGPNPATADVTVNNSGTGVLSWTATVTAGSSWLSVWPNFGVQGESFEASVDVALLGTGVYAGTITIIGGASPVNVPVSLTVVARPVISPSQNSFTFSGWFGGPDPASKQVTIANTGGSTLDWSTSIEYLSGAGWLNVDPTTGTDGAAVTLRVTMMPVGSYSAKVHFIDPEATPPDVPVTVDFVVEAPPVIEVSPASVSLGSFVGGTDPDPVALLITNSGGMSLDWQAAADDGGLGWLSVSQAAGTQGQTTLASAVVGVLAAGDYSGTVTVTDQGGIADPVVVPVSFSVEQAPIIAPFPTELSFTVEVETNPAPATITVNNAGGWQLDWTAAVEYVTGPAGWLSLAGATGTDGGVIAVNVSSSTFAPATYTAKVKINDPSGAAAEVPVTLQIMTTSVAILTPNSVSFNVIMGEADPSQLISVVNSAGQTIPWSASVTQGASWLSLDKTGGTFDDSFTITADASAAGEGTHMGQIEVLGGAEPAYVTVQLVVTSPVTQVAPASVSFTSYVGAAAPETTDLTVTTTAPSLNWQAAAAGGTWLSCAPAAGTEGQTTTVSATVGALAAGDYSGTVTISDQDGFAADVVVPVSLSVKTVPVVQPFPASLSFNVEAENDPASQTITVNNGGEWPLAWTAVAADEGEGWLSIVNNAGTDGEQITVNVASAALAVKTYNGTVTITDAVGGSVATVNVTLNVFTTAVTILTPNSVSFTGYVDEVDPSWLVSVVNSKGQTIAWSAAVTQGAGWLSLDKTGGIYDDSFTATADISAAGVGTHAGEVAVYGGAQPAYLNVQIVVKARPVITPSKTTLAFASCDGGPVPASQTVTITNTGGSTLNWTAELVNSVTWLTVNPMAGGAGTVTTFTCSPAGLTAGPYTETVRLTDLNAQPTQADITVNFQVDAAPVISLATTTVNLNALVGGANPAEQTVQVTNAGEWSLSWSATVEYVTGSGWLTLTNGSGTEGESVTFIASVASLTANTYTALIHVNDPVAATEDIAVTFVVEDPPVIQVSQASITFSTYVGTDPTSEDLTITNGGGTTLDWDALCDDGGLSWLSVSLASGTQGQTTTVSATVGALAAGDYSGTVTVSDQGAVAADVVVPVSLSVKTAPVVQPFPASLSFSVIQGNDPASKTITVNNGGEWPLSWNALAADDGPPSWLSIVGNAGTDGDQITVNVDSAALAAAPYNGTVTISDAVAGAVGVNVTLTVTPNPVTVLAPDSVSFVVYADEADPSRAIAVSEAGGQDLTWTAAVTSGASWLSISKSSGTNTPDSFSVTADVSAAGVGVHSGTVDVQVTGGEIATLDVQLTVKARPVITPSKTTLAFASCDGGPVPASQTVTVTNTGGSTLNWTAELVNSVTWLTVNPMAGGHGTVTTFTCSPAGLTAGPYTETVRLTDLNAQPTQADITVNFQVDAAPIISLAATTVDLNALVGGASPGEQSVQVTNAGGWQLDWSAMVEYAVPGDWLTLLDAAGTDDDSVRFVANVAGLTADTYVATIHVNDPVAATEDITVTFVVEDPPVIQVSQASITFSTYVGTDPTSEGLTITNGGGTTLDWDALCDDGGLSWLSVSLASGTQGDTTVVSADVSSLAAGDYSGTVTVSDQGAVAADVVVPVSLSVKTAPVVEPFPASLSFNAEEGGADPATQTITVNNGGEWTLSWDAVADDGPDDWLAIDKTTGTEGEDVTVTVTSSALAANAYSGTVTITATEGGSVATVNVALVVTAPETPITVLDPTSVSFPVFADEADPTQNVLISNGGTGTLDWTAAVTAGGSWLSIDKNSGTAPDNFNVTADVAAAGVGTWAGEVEVTGGVSTVTLSVQLVVTAPVIQVSQPSVTFPDTDQGGPNPAAETLTITYTGASTLNWQTAVDDGGLGWLSRAPLTGIEDGTTDVSADVAALASGDYSGTVTISEVAGIAADVVVPVSIHIKTAPVVEPFPATLSFNAEEAGTDPASQTIVVNNGGEMSLDWAAVAADDGPPPWLSIVGTTGTDGGTITVSVASSALLADTYNGTVTITDALGSFAVVDVALVVTPSAIPPITVLDPSSLSYSGFTGDADQAWPVVVTNGGGGILNWTAAVTAGGAWLSIDNSAGTEGEGFDVTALVSTLPAGTHTGAITVDGGVDPVTLSVQIVLQNKPVISVSKNSLYFASCVGGAAPAAQTVVVSNSGGSALAWTASKLGGKTWLAVSPTSGTDDATVTFSCSLAGAVLGVNQETVRIADPVAINSPVDISVDFDVDPAPIMSLLPGTVSLSALEGGANQPSSIQVSNTGGWHLEWTATVEYVTGSGWITLVNSSGADDESVELVANVGGLSVGTYDAVIHVYDSVAAEKTATVTLQILAGPQISPAPGSLTFTAEEGGADPSSQAVTVNNSGGGTLFWTASIVDIWGGNWLSIDPTTGTDDMVMTATVSVAGLVPDDYTASIRIHADAAGDVDVPVTFSVSPPVQPQIVATPDTILFEYYELGAPPADQTVAVSVIGGTVDWDFIENCAWLDVYRDVDDLILHCDPAGLSIGSYPTVVGLSGLGADPEQISVTLQVYPAADSDSDGLPDAWEMAYIGSLDETGSDDHDLEGLTNAEEYANGTRPDLPDTDGDGFTDKEEVDAGTDPLDAADPGHGISGVVTDAVQQGVTLTLSGAADATTVSAADGSYAFAGLADGAYVVTPSLSGYVFTPSSQPVTVSGANVANVDFAAAVQTGGGGGGGGGCGSAAAAALAVLLFLRRRRSYRLTETGRKW